MKKSALLVALVFCASSRAAAVDGQALWSESHVFGVSLVYALSFSPDGTRLAVGGLADAQLWDVAAWRQQLQLTGHASLVRSIAWSPDQTQIATGSEDSTIKIWDPVTGELLSTLQGHSAAVNALAWSPDGALLASGSDDEDIRLWTSQGESLGVLGSRRGAVLSLSWTPSQTLASGASDGSVALWSCDGLALELDGHTDWVYSVAWSPDAAHLASASFDKTIKIWRADTGELEQAIADDVSVWTASWDPAGTRLVAGSSSEVTKIWDPWSATLLETLDGQAGWANQAAWSPDGSTDLVASSSLSLHEGQSSILRTWDVNSGQSLHMFSGHTYYVYQVRWSPDFSRLASVSLDGSVFVWDPAGEVLQDFENPDDFGYGIGWSPNLEVPRVAAGYLFENVKIWNPDTGDLVETLRGGHTARINGVAFSPSGELLVSASDDHTLAIWDLASGSVIRPLLGHTREVESVIWWSDSGVERIASSARDNTVRIWDPMTGELLKTLEGHTDSVLSVRLSPDLTKLASGSFDGTIRVWDAASGALLMTIPAHDDWLWSVSWSLDGSKLASSSSDETVKIWEYPAGTPLQTLAKNLGFMGYVYSTDWGPGDVLLSAAQDSTVRAWTPSGNASVKAAKAALFRP